MPVTVPGTGGSLYKVLWVESTATISKIKTAYQSLVKVYHPNLSGGGREQHRLGVRIGSGFTQPVDGELPSAGITCDDKLWRELGIKLRILKML
ncbi:hypothetical protein AB3S75_000005 [Citrus x aurantiifolia]